MNHRQKKKFMKKLGHKKYINARIDRIYLIVSVITFDMFGPEIDFSWRGANNFKRFYKVEVWDGDNFSVCHDVTKVVYQKLRSPVNI